jgi:Zn-dependent peptidase ImmA (M78 family)
MRQVKLLAGFLQRPLSLFFLPEPPKVVPLAAEYRRLAGVVPGQESAELRMAIRQMLFRRENALNLMEELGEEITEFRLSARLNEDQAEVGTRLRKTAGITIEQQEGWSDAWQAWREWRSALESLGVLVFMFPKVTLEEVRGISLLRTPMPVVAVNTKEFAEARAYTALHEVVHLMLAAAQEETSALKDTHTPEQWKAVERFAEVAASHALLPEALLDSAVRKSVPEGLKDLESVRRMAWRFKMTPLATATRLRESGYMTWEEYQAWCRKWDSHVARLPRKKGGFATPVGKTLGRGGRAFAQLVVEALDTNRITPVDASRYLDLKFEHFGRLRERLAAGSHVEIADE